MSFIFENIVHDFVDHETVFVRCPLVESSRADSPPEISDDTSLLVKEVKRVVMAGGSVEEIPSLFGSAATSG